jgi:hypothetical protein
MTEARVEVDSRTIRFRGESPATGEIWVALGESEFPSRRWNDFIVVVLSAFTTALRQLSEGAGHARVYFMDGPHAVDLARGDGAWIVRLVDTGTRETVRAESAVAPAAMLSSVLAAADEVLSAHARARSWSPDVQALADGTAALRARLSATGC